MSSVSSAVNSKNPIWFLLPACLGINAVKTRILILLFLVVLPGFSASAVCAYYLVPEWATLTGYQNYRRVSEAPSATATQISIARTAQEIHRINCFAEGVGLLLGGIIFSIGIQGICILPQKTLNGN